MILQELQKAAQTQAIISSTGRGSPTQGVALRLAMQVLLLLAAAAALHSERNLVQLLKLLVPGRHQGHHPRCHQAGMVSIISISGFGLQGGECAFPASAARPWWHWQSVGSTACLGE